MRTEILHNPDFAVLKVTFDRVGDQIITEAGAMVARDVAVEMRTNVEGTFGREVRRRVFGAENLFQNMFTATAPGQTLLLAPACEGAIGEIDLELGGEMFLQSGAYLASTPGLVLDSKWHGARAFFAGGTTLLRAYGEGRLWLSSYGALHAIDLVEGEPGYVCDNAHLVGFTAGLRHEVRRAPGLKSLFFAGEGLVTDFSGEGRLWLQTKNPAALAHFLHPFRRVGAR